MPGVLDFSGFPGPDPFLYRAVDAGGASELVAQVTVSEDHEDELTITENPVEQGADVTDHAFKRPAQLRVTLGWSQSGGSYGASMVADVAAIYEQILTLQSSRRPFDVYTGKRHYQNMLIASLRTRTDQTLETSFIAEIGFQQILLVDTRFASGTAAGSAAVANPSAAQLANPQSNQPTVSQGAVQTTPASLTPAQVTQAGGLVSGLPLPGAAS